MPFYGPKGTPPELCRDIVAYYETPHTLDEVAQRFGISKTGARKIVVRILGSVRPSEPRAKPIELRKRIVAFYQAPNTVKATAKEFGFPYTTIHKIIVRMGALRTEPRGYVPPETISEIKRRWEAGEIQRVIAEAVSLPQTKISMIIKQMGFEIRGRNIGPKHGGWKGGRTMMHGYVKVWLSPNSAFWGMSDLAGYVLEHRLVMAQKIGRPLTRLETVHHIDGNRQNNALENLQLRNGKHGTGSAFVCADCGSHNIVATKLKDHH